MRALTTTELMAVWELGMPQPWGQRALALLAAASEGDEPPQRLAQCSIGQRNARLLTLRERTFGPQMAALAPCPKCGDLSEFGISVDELRVAPAPEPAETLGLSHGEYEVSFRLPNSLDLACLDPSAEARANRQSLLARCLLRARCAGAEVTAERLPPGVVAAIAERMAQADPQADVQIALACPSCRQAWQAPLDILSFFWSEINAWAQRILHEVHVLASAYGWREADILAMTPSRRQTYLGLAER